MKKIPILIILFISTVFSISNENEIRIISINESSNVITLDWILKVPEKVKSQSICYLNNELNISSMLAPNRNIKTSIYFLIDSSIPMKDIFDSKIKPFIKDIITNLDGERHSYQIATFDSDIKIVKKFNEEDNLSLLDTIKIDGQRTELYRLTLEALKELNRENNKRKYLFIFSDGDYEDIAYTHNDIVSFAKSNMITILSFGYKNSIKLQSIRRLAEDTDGKIWIENSLDNIQEILKYIDNGGRLKFNIIDFRKNNKLTLNVKTENNFFQKNIEINSIQDNKDGHANWHVIIPTILLLLIIIFLYIKNRKIGVSKNSSPKLNNIKRVAYIETVSGKVFNIIKKSTSIGRSKENDIVITGKYISKYHAEILFKNNTFYIIDKNSENGIRINKSGNINKYILKDGDIIYLGPFKLYFKEEK